MITWDNGHYFAYEIIGEFRSRDTWIHPDRKVGSYELIFVLHGTLYITEEDTAYEVRENEMIILEPCKRHFGTRETTEFVSFYWFHFHTNLPVQMKKIAPDDVYDIKFFLKKLLHITNSGEQSQENRESADALGFLIYNECIKPRNSLYKNVKLAADIKEYIRLNLKENVTVSEIADHYGYNVDYIGKLFKANFGLNLKKYIALQRLNLAKDLLLTTMLSVKQIAGEIGYEDENAFVKFFVYHEKMSPTVFRNNYFNTHINNR